MSPPKEDSFSNKFLYIQITSGPGPNVHCIGLLGENFKAFLRDWENRIIMRAILEP